MAETIPPDAADRMSTWSPGTPLDLTEARIAGDLPPLPKGVTEVTLAQSVGLARIAGQPPTLESAITSPDVAAWDGNIHTSVLRVSGATLSCYLKYVVGNGNQVDGDRNCVIGNDNVVNGENNVVYGENNTLGGHQYPSEKDKATKPPRGLFVPSLDHHSSRFHVADRGRRPWLLPYAWPDTVRVLRIHECPNLVCIVNLPPLLERLEIREMKHLQWLPLLPSSLRVLVLEKCPRLAVLPPLPDTLEEIECRKCAALRFYGANTPRTLTCTACEECPDLTLPDHPEDMEEGSALIGKTLVAQWLEAFPSLQHQLLGDPMFEGLCERGAVSKGLGAEHPSRKRKLDAAAH